MFTLVSLSLMGGGQVEGLKPRSPPFKIPKNLCVVLFSFLLGPFLLVKGPFSPFWGLFSLGGVMFYVEIYLDLSPLTKISAGVHASAAKVVPNILEHRVM